VERCLASSFVRLSRTLEDKCEADLFGTTTACQDHEATPLAHDRGGSASSRAVRASPTRGRWFVPQQRSAIGLDTRGSGGSDVTSAGEERATRGKLCRTGSDPSRQLGRFGRNHKPFHRLQAAFSLVEVLASLFILTLSAVGITAAWRLADYQELLTRVDRRAERILREYYELQTFAPPDSRPFTASASPSPSPITGYLYYPRQIANQNGSGAFGNMVPFSISMTNAAAGTTQLVLTYTIPSYGTQASRQVTKTVVLNP
jgi:hypothetical protein